MKLWFESPSLGLCWTSPAQQALLISLADTPEPLLCSHARTHSGLQLVQGPAHRPGQIKPTEIQLAKKKLTDTQRVVLSNAAMQLDGAVLPLPRSIRLNSAAMNIVLKSLLTQALILERPAAHEESSWREDETGRRFMLIISDEGCAAIDVEPVGTGPAKAPDVEQDATSGGTSGDEPLSADSSTGDAPAARAGTKLATLIEALSAPDGASIPQLIEVTGWQAHSIRGAISGALKKRGIAVTSDKTDRGRVYRMTSGPATASVASTEA